MHGRVGGYIGSRSIQGKCLRVFISSGRASRGNITRNNLLSGKPLEVSFYFSFFLEIDWNYPPSADPSSLVGRSKEFQIRNSIDLCVCQLSRSQDTSPADSVPSSVAPSLFKIKKRGGGFIDGGRKGDLPWPIENVSLPRSKRSLHLGDLECFFSNYFFVCYIRIHFQSSGVDLGKTPNSVLLSPVSAQYT